MLGALRLVAADDWRAGELVRWFEKRGREIELVPREERSCQCGGRHFSPRIPDDWRAGQFPIAVFPADAMPVDPASGLVVVPFVFREDLNGGAYLHLGVAVCNAPCHPFWQGLAGMFALSVVCDWRAQGASIYELQYTTDEDAKRRADAITLFIRLLDRGMKGEVLAIVSVFQSRASENSSLKASIRFLLDQCASRWGAPQSAYEEAARRTLIALAMIGCMADAHRIEYSAIIERALRRLHSATRGGQ